MADSLAVLMGDRVAGSLVRLGGGQLRFDYDADYRKGDDPTPLSLSMPLPVASHAHVIVSSWLWGLLPDNEAVIARWAKTFRASASSVFSLMATPVGEDCAGAVRFATPERLGDSLTGEGALEWLSESDVEERLRDLRDDGTAWLGRASSGQFSLAGAQAKTALFYRDGRWALPSGAMATTHILKPAIRDLDDHDLNEHLCLDAAGQAGIAVARTEVRRFGAESAIVVERYDRREVDGHPVRVHQEDLCQALGMHPSLKYQSDGGPTPGGIAAGLRGAMPGRAGDRDVRRFADALIWNWLIAGTDAHAKNYSVLLSGGQVRLAPLYDIASALPYGDHEKKLRFAMKIGGDYRVYPYRSTWAAAADELGLDPEELIQRARDLAERAPDAFAEAAAAPAVVALDSAMPNRLVDLVSGRAARCRRILD